MRLRPLLGAFGAALLLFVPTFALAGDNSTVEPYVRAYFADIPVMINIASCETQFHQFNSDGSVIHGGYRHHMIGLFQFAPFHASTASALGMDINTLLGNMEYARYLYGQSGTTPWLDSSPCWETMSEATPSAHISAGAVADDASSRLANLQQEAAQLSAALQALMDSHAAS